MVHWYIFHQYTPQDGQMKHLSLAICCTNLVQKVGGPEKSYIRMAADSALGRLQSSRCEVETETRSPEETGDCSDGQGIEGEEGAQC